MIRFVAFMTIVSFAMYSCEKEEEVYQSDNTELIYGTYKYYYFKGTIIDSLGAPIDGNRMILQVSPCLSSTVIQNGNYSMWACERIGGKSPYYFDGQIRLRLMDTVTDQYISEEFTFSSDLLIDGDTAYIDLQL